jgi:hypothetical protein
MSIDYCESVAQAWTATYQADILNQKEGAMAHEKLN